MSWWLTFFLHIISSICFQNGRNNNNNNNWNALQQQQWLQKLIMQCLEFKHQIILFFSYCTFLEKCSNIIVKWKKKKIVQEKNLTKKPTNFHSVPNFPPFFYSNSSNSQAAKKSSLAKNDENPPTHIFIFQSPTPFWKHPSSFFKFF
jgi:hypothetical protein